MSRATYQAVPGKSRRNSQQQETHKSSRGRSIRSASECGNKKSPPTADFQRSQSVQSQQQQPQQNLFSRSGFEQILLEKPSFPDFFKRVNCPCCWEVQKDRIQLVKHLNQSCPKRKLNKKLQSIFQILPDNCIKCNICPNECFDSAEGYFLHLSMQDHVFRCNQITRKGKQLTDSLYCSCCCMQVPDNVTQLQAHLEHEVHKVRSTGTTSADLWTNGFICVYHFYSGRRTFRCLSCSSSNLFYSPLEMMQHLKNLNHSKRGKNCSDRKIYCGFCKTGINVFEAPFHFTSDAHKENEKIAGEGAFELCFYCGFSCGDLQKLSQHMRDDCCEIMRINEEIGSRQKKEKLEDRKQGDAKKAKKQCCIFVKDDIDVVELLKILRPFGQMKPFKRYINEYLMIEFRHETSVEDLCLVREFLKINNNPVCIKLPGEVEEDEAATTSQTDLQDEVKRNNHIQQQVTV